MTGTATIMNSLASILRLPLAQLPDPLPLAPVPPGPRHALIRPPGSKSLTNRLLLLAALAPGRCELRRPLLDADDAQRMLAAIVALGAAVEHTPAGLVIRGTSGRWAPTTSATLNLHNAGTATRFLAASALLARVPLVIDGNERMRQRPIAELTGALATLGVGVEFLCQSPACPPVRLTPPPGNIPTRSEVTLGPTQSSQFISGLLLVAPFLPAGLTLRLEGQVTSASYVRMTTDLLTRLGVCVRASADLSVIRVLPGFERFSIDVEPDASGATYFAAAGALLPDAALRIVGLPTDSLQGDARFPDVLEAMGCTVARARLRTPDADEPVVSVRAPDALRPVEADMADMPDAVMSLAAVACFAQGRTIVRGVRTLRVKETDRVEALRVELGRVGVVVTPDFFGDPDALAIDPPQEDPEGGIARTPDVPPVTFHTYDDHRMAMSLALIGLRRPNVRIQDPGCVAKTYPGYWADLAMLYDA